MGGPYAVSALRGSTANGESVFEVGRLYPRTTPSDVLGSESQCPTAQNDTAPLSLHMHKLNLHLILSQVKAWAKAFPGTVPHHREKKTQC